MNFIGMKYEINFQSIMKTKNFCLVFGHIHNQCTIFSPRDLKILFFYLPNTKSKWNNGGGTFSHPYVIMHKYFVKKP